ncbi:MAG: hypothetical protein A2Y14_03960 [Verrucomicrobia bacterium GWF2_51_19]|nr:MAG: hypothetical protein A2Y14_03960 [Verrucomicrobia bacterium GWF2_51_19]HCJ11685.1 hypothetical protein [Opitutae bacterium]
MSQCTLKIKAIPNARQEGIVGWVGDRLKVKVSVPPEAGRANKAVIALLAEKLNIPTRSIVLIKGLAFAEKTLTIEGLSESDIRKLLKID